MEALQNIFQAAIVQRIGWVLVHFVWQAAAIAVVLAIILRMMRKSSASLRYIVACIALVLTVLMPVVTIGMIEVDVEVVEPVAQAVVELPAVDAEPDVIVEMPLAELVPVQAEPLPSVPLQDRFIAAVEPVLPYAVIGWLFGVFGLSLWHLGGWRQLQRLRRQMVKDVAPALTAKLSQLSKALGISRAVGLVESALVQVPTVVGHLKPMILLPASALTGLSTEQIEAILAHELAHIKRCDYLVNMLQTVVEILGFYHPAVWWVSHKIRVERENCCDDIAVDLCSDKLCYAKALTTMEEIRASRPALAVAASGGNLLERIRRLLGKDSANENKISWLPSVIVMVLICSMLIPVGLAMSDGTASSKFPSFIIRGTVTDAQTGKPIANAKVGDGEKYNKGKLGAVTGANGKYEYKTWYEEHNITAEAKGYETGRKGLYTKFIGSEKETVIDFKLTPFKSLLVGRYEPGVETAVNLASADKLLDCKSIKFEQSRQGHVSAVMLLEVTSYPKTKWEIEVGLVDGEGKGVKTVSEQFENSGYAIGDPIYSKEVFILDFGKVAGIDKVKSFVVRIYNSSAADNLYLTEYQMNIAGRIFQSLSDELKQIASKYPELAKFQRLNQTASLATPSGDAIRVLDLSYKHNFTAPKGKRKIRSSDFGENGFYFNLKCAPIPPSHVPAYAMSPPTLILRKLGVYLWAEVKTGANPSPGVVEEVQSLLKTQLEKFKKYDNGFTMRTDEKPAQPVKGGPQVVIEAKFIEVYNKFLEDIGFVEPYVYGKPGILNDSQTELLLRIAPERSDSKVLANPKVHVRDNERGSIAIMTEKAYVSGYTEVESAPDKPKAKVEYFDSGIKTDLTPHITEDGKNVRLGFKFIFSDMNAGRAFLYKGRHPYHKPEMLVTDIVTEVVIPDGETFLCEPVQITRYDANLKAVKKTLLILLKPTIILSPDEPAKSSVAVKLGGGGGVVGVDEKVSKAQVSSFTGRYEPGKETAVNLASADNLLSFCRATDKLFYCKSIKFEQSRQGQVKALMQLGVTSFPKKKWQIEVRLLDGAGKQVKAVSEKFENSGVIGRRASHTKEVLALDFGKVADIEKVKNFLIMIRGEKKVSDPSIPAPLISAPLISELQPMAKTKQAVKDGPQVSIETRYISVDEKFFEELGIDLFEKNETTAMLDDLSVRFIIRAMERQPRATMLTAPKVTVWNNEQAKINITKDWRYVSGYKELESAPERPVKKTKEFTSGIKVNVTPNVSEDGRSITLELESKFSNFSLGKIHRYKKRHLYYEPDISVKDIAATATISDGGTLLIDGGPDASFKINDRSHDGHLLIMVKPSILKPRVEVD